MKIKALSLAVSAALYGCGGGSGGGNLADLNQPSVQPQAVSQPQVKSTFNSVPIELPIFQDYFFPKEKSCPGSQPLVTAVDLNNDGRKDLVVHMWCGVGEGNVGKPKAESTDDSLAVFLQKSDGTFEYANEQVFGTKIVRFYASSRKVTVADFNNDGLPDLAYAVNMEDGREVAQGSMSLSATAVVVISESKGKYRIDKLGTPDWFHSVDSVKTATGNDVIFAGFTGQKQAFRFVNGAWVSVSDQYPNVSALTFRYTDDGKTVVSNTDDRTPGNPASLAKHTFVNGQWFRKGEYLVNGFFVSMLGMNNTPYNVFATNVDNNLHVAAGYDESCFLKMSPTETYYVGKYGANVISNYVNGTVVQSNNGQYKITLNSFNINDIGTKLPSIIENEVTDINYNSVECTDINNDGYGDIVVHPLWQKAREGIVVYLNNKKGKLVKMDSSIFPTSPYNNTSSLYEDLDNDGVPDLLYWSVSDNIKPLMFKGNKFLAN